MSFSQKKRFIAGAVCPKCSEMDKLMAYHEDGKDKRECVACGYQNEMQFQQAPRELETRVNTSDEEKQAETQAVKIVGLD